ncbi:hypothetical protein EV360DRAFT_49312, partial [Lentinula raphanica]
VLTRWTSHYIAFDCLLDLCPTLVFIVSRDKITAPSQLVTGDAASKQKARGMLSLIEETNFWLAIARCVISVFSNKYCVRNFLE